MGPLIDKGAVERYSQAIAQAKAAGGKVHHGRARSSRARATSSRRPSFSARNDWPIVQHETFAPVMYLIPFDSLEEAIEMQNAVRARPVVGDLHRPPAARRSLPVGGGQ